MNLLVRLLRRFGFVRPSDYGFQLTPDGRLVPLGASAPPAWSADGPGSLSPLSSPSAAEAGGASAAPPAATAPPRAPATSAPPHAPPPPQGGSAGTAPEPAVAGSAEPPVHSRTDEEEWEWRVALARARARLQAERNESPPQPDNAPAGRTEERRPRMARGSAPPVPVAQSLRPAERRAAAAGPSPARKPGPPPIPRSAGLSPGEDFSPTDTRVEPAPPALEESADTRHDVRPAAASCEEDDTEGHTEVEITRPFDSHAEFDRTRPDLATRAASARRLSPRPAASDRTPLPRLSRLLNR